MHITCLQLQFVTTSRKKLVLGLLIPILNQHNLANKILPRNPISLHLLRIPVASGQRICRQLLSFRHLIDARPCQFIQSMKYSSVQARLDCARHIPSPAYLLSISLRLFSSIPTAVSKICLLIRRQTTLFTMSQYLWYKRSERFAVAFESKFV